MHSQKSSIISLLLLFFTMAFFAACGGSGGSGDSASTATITGSIFAAPVSGASVIMKNSSGSAIAGPVSTASDGTYRVTVLSTALSSDLRIESSSGSYIDEASGVSTTAKTLAAYVSGGTLTSGASVNIGPSTTIVYDLVTKSSKTVGEAEAIFSKAFGFIPNRSVVPKNAPTSGSDMTERLAGLRAIAFSRMTRDLGLAPGGQFDLIEAIADDLSDGTLDSRNSTTIVSIGTGTVMPEDIENRFEQAMLSLLSDTSCNKTGLTADQIGALPFAKVALTSTYRVEYVPGMMAAAQGKTAFKLKITKRSDGSAATGLSVSLMPMMHMAADQHATPVDVVTESSTPGTYNCTVYYLMSSVMNGMSMGYWELAVNIGGMMGETTAFHPSVGMTMGDTSRATLKGQNDVISGMTGTEKRSYYLFHDGLISGSTDTFDLFIAAKESMMSYPAASIGTVLSSPNGTITSMVVRASTDNVTWISGTDNTGSHWSIPGLTGLSTGVTGTIYVKLSVNGEDKTIDGLASNLSGTNTYATFTVTPH